MKSSKDWLIIGLSTLPGPVIAFTFAFDPGVCNPNFSDVNFIGLTAFGALTSMWMLFCVGKAWGSRRS